MLPSPLPMRARRSLPQMMNQITAPSNRTTMARMMPVMILRFLLMGFFSFLGFLACSFILESSLALSSPVCSSKSKVCTGLRKSSVTLGVGVVDELSSVG